MNKEINLPSGNYIFIKISNNAYDFEMRRNNQVVFLLKDVINPFTGSEKSDIIEIPNVKFGIEIKDLEIIATINNITEEQCENLIDNCDIYAKCWKKYTSQDNTEKSGRFNSMYSCWTAKESLQSLLQANNLNIENNYLIIKTL